jgi:hypothetical protein
MTPTLQPGKEAGKGGVSAAGYASDVMTAPPIDRTPTSLAITLETNGDDLDLDVVRESLAKAGSITAPEVRQLRVISDSAADASSALSMLAKLLYRAVVVAITVPRFAAEILLKSYRTGSLTSIIQHHHRISIISLSIDDISTESSYRTMRANASSIPMTDTTATTSPMPSITPSHAPTDSVGLGWIPESRTAATTSTYYAAELERIKTLVKQLAETP